jgi:hypothetical protein
MILLAAVLTLQAEGPVVDVAPPPAWDRFLMLVWQHQTDVVRDRALYESVNLRGFHVDRENGKLQAFGKESGWPYYVDHAAGKGILHLGRLADPLLKKPGLQVRPNSLADPKTMERLKELLRAHLSRAKGGTAVAYAFDDEVSSGHFGSPVETDAHPLSIAAFRKALAADYGGIERLNAQYGTAYASFDDVAPPSFEAVRGQLKADALGRLNLSAWSDFRTFMDAQWAGALAELTRFANSIDPSVPAGFVGGGNPCAWGGMDVRRLSTSVQWMEAYDIGGSNEILRSFWDRKRPRMQTFFSSKDPKRDAWFLWYYLCHGNRGVICWPEGWFRDGKVADPIAANAAVFKEVQGPVSAKIVDGVFAHDPIAIYYSHPSIQATWALDAATHGRTWPNRSSSLENALSTSSLTRVAWLKTLEDLGYQAKFIHQDHLLAGELVKGGFKVLLLNRALCLSDAEAAAVRDFAAKGGVVVADHLCGVLDGRGKARPSGALDELFGARRDLSKGLFAGDALSEVDAEKGGTLDAKTWRPGPTRLGMAVVERGLETTPGRHAYLNLSPTGYLLQRTSGGGNEWKEHVAGLLKSAGLSPRLRIAIDGRPARMTEAIFWRNGARTTLCLVQNLDRKARIDGFGATEGDVGAARVRLRLDFAAPVRDLVDERSGRKLGDGASFEDGFTPWEANVYSFAP